MECRVKTLTGLQLSLTQCCFRKVCGAADWTVIELTVLPISRDEQPITVQFIITWVDSGHGKHCILTCRGRAHGNLSRVHTRFSHVPRVGCWLGLGVVRQPIGMLYEWDVKHLAAESMQQAGRLWRGTMTSTSPVPLPGCFHHPSSPLPALSCAPVMTSRVASSRASPVL